MRLPRPPRTRAIVEFSVEKAGKRNFLILEEGKRLELFCLDKHTADRVASALVHQNDSGLQEMLIDAATRADERSKTLEDACKAVCEGCREGMAIAKDDYEFARHIDETGAVRRACFAQSIRALIQEGEHG